jgi:hypothetical protein
MVQRMSTESGARERFDHYKRLIRAFSGSARGDRYLFAIYVEASGSFAFEHYTHS